MPTETRRSFLRKLACAATGSAVLGALPRLQAETAAPSLPSSGWARLITPNVTWNFHGNRDRELSAFVGLRAGLKFSTRIRAVRPDQLEALCAFPFLFTNDFAWVRDPQALQNLREYLYRGGFIYTDACSSTAVTSSFRTYYFNQLSMFSHLVPGATFRRLPPGHAIFHSCFDVPAEEVDQFDALPTDPRWEGMSQGIFGVWDDDRLIGAISLEHLFCGWPEDLPRMEWKMKQITNIYAYAMNQ